MVDVIKYYFLKKIKKCFFIPKGFGHAFVSLEDNTEFFYKTTDYYCPKCEGGIIYNDKDLNIEWNLKEYRVNKLLVSQKDIRLPTLQEWLYKSENKGFKI